MPSATKYPYVHWNYTFGNAAVVDLFYIGVPGSNEFNLGGGYAFKRGRLVLTPLLYVVFGKEGAQRGVKAALVAAFEKDGWKLLSFLGHYAPISGAVSSYQVLDTLDLTRTIGTRWEAGIQAGFFRADGAWETQVGPLLKLNDRLGAGARPGLPGRRRRACGVRGAHRCRQTRKDECDHQREDKKCRVGHGCAGGLCDDGSPAKTREWPAFA